MTFICRELGIIAKDPTRRSLSSIMLLVDQKIPVNVDDDIELKGRITKVHFVIHDISIAEFIGARALDRFTLSHKNLEQESKIKLYYCCVSFSFFLVKKTIQ